MSAEVFVGCAASIQVVQSDPWRARDPSLFAVVAQGLQQKIVTIDERSRFGAPRDRTIGQQSAVWRRGFCEIEQISIGPAESEKT